MRPECDKKILDQMILYPGSCSGAIFLEKDGMFSKIYTDWSKTTVDNYPTMYGEPYLLNPTPAERAEFAKQSFAGLQYETKVARRLTELYPDCVYFAQFISSTEMLLTETALEIQKAIVSDGAPYTGQKIYTLTVSAIANARPLLTLLPKLTEHERATAAINAVCAYQLLDKAGVMHRDGGLHNLLYSDGRLVVIDWDRSQCIELGNNINSIVDVSDPNDDLCGVMRSLGFARMEDWYNNNWQPQYDRILADLMELCL